MADKTVQRLVDYAASLKFNDLPWEVVQQVKRLIIDSLGCGICAFNSPPVKIARELASTYSGTKTATLLGTATQSTPDLAAFVNGIMVRYLDFNDNYAGKSNAHPSDNVAPMIAAAEASKATGKDLITGIVLSYEVQSAWADTFRLKDGGPWDQATYPTIAMPLGAGKIMGLNKRELAEALRISIAQGIPLLEARRGEISHWKACAVPNAGRNGILAALLAKSGLTGPPMIFEGEAGFFKAVTNEFVNFEKLAMEECNNNPFRIMKSSIKRFPAGFFSQTAIEGAMIIRETLDIKDTREIKTVDIGTFDHGYNVMGRDPTRWRPQTRETADHSLPFVVACALQFGSVDLKHFVPEVFTDNKLIELMDKIKVSMDPESQSAWPNQALNKVTVEMMDGRTHTEKTPYYRGHFRQPMGDLEIKEKFSKLTGNFLLPMQREEFFETVNELENLKEIRDIYGNLLVQI